VTGTKTNAAHRGPGFRWVKRTSEKPRMHPQPIGGVNIHESHDLGEENSGT